MTSRSDRTPTAGAPERRGQGYTPTLTWLSVPVPAEMGPKVEGFRAMVADGHLRAIVLGPIPGQREGYAPQLQHWPKEPRIQLVGAAAQPEGGRRPTLDEAIDARVQLLPAHVFMVIVAHPTTAPRHVLDLAQMGEFTTIAPAGGAKLT